MTDKPFKPSRSFLEKVEAGGVRSVFTYSMRAGGQYGFRGGELTYEKHRDAGYCTPTGGASLGRPGVSKLTDKGREFLARTSTPAS